MRNITLCVLAAIVLFFAPTTAQAGFMVKKSVAIQATQSMSATSNESSILVKNSEVATTLSALGDSPSGVFVRWAHNGTLGTFALLFGILSFFAPLFSMFALVFGFIGMKSFCRSRGVAIVGFVLGLVALCITIFSGFAPLPIF